MTNEKLYDLSMIRDMLGEEEEVKNMIGIFVESTPVSLHDMNEGFKEDNADKLARNAHKMKASLDMLKINSLYDDVRKIDKDFKVEDIPQNELEEIIKKMNSVLELVFKKLKEEFKL
ncbi:MAG: Hpt domain-containing protein [Bacteroidales bacterium]|nr:Hpt domain-containing protein [Bacteroidales bacterium]